MSRALSFAAGFVAPLVICNAASAAPPGPFQKGPYLQDLAPDGVTVRLELAAPGTAKVEVREEGSDAGTKAVVESREAAGFHAIRLSGLTPRTTYAYAVKAGGATESGKFTTAPPVDTKDEIRFLLYGDNRTDEVGHASVVRALEKTPSDFLLHTGDFVQNGANAADWQTFFDVERTLLRDRCVFACVGNHELLDAQGAAYLRYFGPIRDSDETFAARPRLFGSFRWGYARFFLLNAMDRWNSGPERAWLEEELSRADDETGLVWRVVVLHHGPWSAGPHGSNEEMLRANIPSALVKHKVDVIFAGHDHLYERGFEDGLRYVISGGGGAPLYREIHPLASTRKVEAALHFVEVALRPDTFSMTAKRADGSTLDACSFTKASSSWDCDPRPTVKVAQAASQPTPVGSRCSCRVAGGASERPSGMVGVGVLAGAVAAIVARRRGRYSRGR